MEKGTHTRLYIYIEQRSLYSVMYRDEGVHLHRAPGRDHVVQRRKRKRYKYIGSRSPIIDIIALI